MVLKGINRLMMATMYFGREGTVKGSWLLNERQSDQKLSEEKKKWKDGWAKRLLETGPTEGDKGLSKKDGGDSRLRGSGGRAATDGGLTD
jgi:hypothetical protein